MTSACLQSYAAPITLFLLLANAVTRSWRRCFTSVPSSPPPWVASAWLHLPSTSTARWCGGTGHRHFPIGSALHSHVIDATVERGGVRPVEKRRSPSRSEIEGGAPDGSRRHHQMYHVHLLSVPYPAPNATTDEGILLQDFWLWKDRALGDGADHFVPRRQRRRRRGTVEFVSRSEALRQFQMLFVGMEIRIVGGSGCDDGLKLALKNGHPPHVMDLSVSLGLLSSLEPSSFETTFTVEECSVLSTCARFDVILVIRSNSLAETNDSTLEMDTVKAAAGIASLYAVASTVHEQVRASRQSTSSDQQSRVVRIASQLAHLEGTRSISKYLALVASGLTRRPDRPTSDVIFRPYSSRDTHILMQLKRCVEVISVLGDQARKEDTALRRKECQRRKKRKRRNKSIGNAQSRRKATSKMNSPSRGRIKVLLDSALRAGKMARNADVVPKIARLRKFTSEDAVPPDELCGPVIGAVMKSAISPSVNWCTSRLAAMDDDMSARIQRLRKRVLGTVDDLAKHEGRNNLQLKQLANRLLHKPTMQIREGRLNGKEIESVAVGIERQLRQH
ncbi:hypothetical protein ACHAWF_016520 [Thalassiosira exigua]